MNQRPHKRQVTHTSNDQIGRRVPQVGASQTGTSSRGASQQGSGRYQRASQQSGTRFERGSVQQGSAQQGGARQASTQGRRSASSAAQTAGTHQARAGYVHPATQSSYTRSSRGRKASRRSPLKPILAVVAVIAVLALGIFGITRVFAALSSGSGSNNTNIDEVATTTITEDEASSAAIESTDPGEIVIGLNGSADTYVLKGEEYLEAGAHAAEPTDGILNSAIEVSGEVDASKAGDYTVTYTVSDSTGHTATAQRAVHVVESMDKQETGIPVLMYHYVYADGAPPSDLNENYISVSNLSAEFNYLKENGFYFPSYQEVAAFIQGTHSLPKNSIVLTFDDAEGSFLDNGIPVAEQYQVPITSFSIGMYDIDQYNEIHCASAYVSYQSHSYSLHQGGGSVGHGGLISALTKDEIVEDLKKAQEWCGTTEAFAYPFGDVTDDGKAAVKDAGILCAFTTVNGWCKIGDDCTELNRVRINGSVSLDSYITLVTTVQ